jgi:hypothetical protein
MAMQRTPHTESEQNVRVSQTDLEPEDIEQDSGREDEGLYTKYDGAQTGEERGPQFWPGKDGHPNIEAATSAHEGDLRDRATGSQIATEPTVPGITSRPEEERARQEKVVKERPDAQAGVNRDAP